MTKFHITMTMKIDAIVEGENAEAVARSLGDAVGDALLTMGAGNEGREGICELFGDIKRMGDNAASEPDAAAFPN